MSLVTSFNFYFHFILTSSIHSVIHYQMQSQPENFNLHTYIHIHIKGSDVFYCGNFCPLLKLASATPTKHQTSWRQIHSYSMFHFELKSTRENSKGIPEGKERESFFSFLRFLHVLHFVYVSFASSLCVIRLPRTNDS